MTRNHTAGSGKGAVSLSRCHDAASLVVTEAGAMPGNYWPELRADSTFTNTALTLASVS